MHSDSSKIQGGLDGSSFIIKNGRYDVREDYNSFVESYTCGDTLIMLGEEEAYRRTTRSLDEYMRNPPEISVMRALEKA